MSAHPDSIGPEEAAVDDKSKATHPIDGPAETGERRRTHHDIPDHGHNPSTQTEVEQNPDLALHYSHEHQHQHLHHNRASLAGRHDEVLYSEGTTTDQHQLGPQNPQDYVRHSLRPAHVDEKDFITMDAEKGAIDPPRIETDGSEDDGKRHRLSRSYSKYKIFVHLFIWLLFTG